MPIKTIAIIPRSFPKTARSFPKTAHLLPFEKNKVKAIVILQQLIY